MWHTRHGQRRGRLDLTRPRPAGKCRPRHAPPEPHHVPPVQGGLSADQGMGWHQLKQHTADRSRSTLPQIRGEYEQTQMRINGRAR